MYQPLVPCSSCHRHVRATEAACPFCASALPNARALAREQVNTGGLSRAAVLALGAALSLVACSDDDSGTGTGTGQIGAGGAAGSSAGGAAGASGGAAGSGTAGAAGDQGFGGSALYGAPPPQGGAGGDTAGPVYGAPPAAGAGGVGGGPDDPGSGNADYGAPPPQPLSPFFPRYRSEERVCPGRATLSLVQKIIRQIIALLWRLVREFVLRWLKDLLKKSLYFVVVGVMIVAFVAVVFSLFR
jgi:hypothetical protein